jgi:hypothetical protein
MWGNRLVSLPVKIGLIVLAIVALTGAGVFAATILNKTVPATIAITALPGGGGGGTPPPGQVDVYRDSAFTDSLSSLAFVYTQGGSHEITVYVKETEVSSGTIDVVGTGLPASVVLTKTVGAPIAGTPAAIPITVHLTGGATGSYSGVGVVFTGNHP